MIPRDCKRLAEVDFPIATVGRHALAEKARRMGTPHQLHLWWAWRPLAACRAVSLALLLPDPCDPLCPDGFSQAAVRLLSSVQGTVPRGADNLRQALLKFIGDFASYALSNSPAYLSVGRSLVEAAWQKNTPLVIDPFAGGGSIPLEGQRLGCEVFASDLNSVAALILKVKLEGIRRLGSGISATLQHSGDEIKQELERELESFYPADPDGSRPIAYIWARTVRCDDCGAEIPLVRSWWLSKKKNRRRAMRYNVVRPSGRTPRIEIEIFEPKRDDEVPPGTVNRAKARCPSCRSVLAPERVRAQLAAQRGGGDVTFGTKGDRESGALLLAVVTVKDGADGRRYRGPMERDYEAVWKASERLRVLTAELTDNGLAAVPNEPLPPVGTLGFRVQRYGVVQWGDLHTTRQKLALVSLARMIRGRASESCVELLALTLSKLAERLNTLCDWMLDVECPGHLYTQQVVPPGWDFAEAVPLGSSSGSFELVMRHTVANATTCLTDGKGLAHASQGDATSVTLPDESVDVFFTDPPYYDAVPYSDLSDFFFVWLKRALPNHPLLRDPFDRENPLTPKSQEIVQDEARTADGHPKDRRFFEKEMARSFSEGRRVLKNDGIGCVVFAHKTTEGWEALLSGMINGGWVISASWPIATERSARMRARDSAALESSIHLVCRPRPRDAHVGEWASVRRELSKRVKEWMERLQTEGIRGADLVFACIGPALEIYSRYARVVDANDRDIPLGGDAEAVEPHERGYLAYVWEVVGRSALEQVLGQAEATVRNGAAGAVEEDARLTALFLWTLQSTAGVANGNTDATGDEDEEKDEEATKAAKKGLALPYDVVRRFAQPLGIHLDRWENRIVDQYKGVVRLLPVSERAEQLFGEEGAQSVALELERSPAGRVQMTLFPDAEAAPGPKRKKGRAGAISQENVSGRNEATTLDRVHAAMLLQRSGKTQALRRLLAGEQERGPDFLRLANALSALYPSGSEEERLLDAMLLAVPR